MSSGIEVIHGDCLEVMRGMADGSVDAVVTDPPYGLGKSTLGWAEKGYRRISEEWDSELPTAWLAEAYRLLRDGGTLLAFGVWKTFEQLLIAEREAGFTRRDIIVWDKVNTMPNITARGYQYSHEFILWSTKGGGYDWNAPTQTRDILRFTWSQGSRQHPSQKTFPLMADLIGRHTSPGALVVDPFMGSGSTGIACVKAGRRFIGIERDPRYFRIAQRKLREVETPLFGEIPCATA